MKYKFLLFDADNTILDFSRCEKEILLDMASRFGLPLESRDGENLVSVYRRHNAAVWHELEEGTMDPDTVKVERFRRLLGELVIRAVSPPVPAERLNWDFIARLSRCGHLVPTADSILKTYAPVVMVTNGFADVQHSRIDRAGVRDLFSHIFISEEIGAAKPQPQFFETVLRELGSPDPGACLVIGDSLNSDIRGGNQAGIDTCWLDRRRNNGGIDPGGPQPTYHIRRLADIHSIVDGA